MLQDFNFFALTHQLFFHELDKARRMLCGAALEMCAGHHALDLFHTYAQSPQHLYDTESSNILEPEDACAACAGGMKQSGLLIEADGLGLDADNPRCLSDGAEIARLCCGILDDGIRKQTVEHAAFLLQ